MNSLLAVIVSFFRSAPRPARHAMTCLALLAVCVLVGPLIYLLGDPLMYPIVNHGLVAHTSELTSTPGATWVDPAGFTAGSWYSIGGDLVAFRPLDRTTHLPALTILCAITGCSSLLGVVFNLAVGRCPTSHKIKDDAASSEPHFMFS